MQLNWAIAQPNVFLTYSEETLKRGKFLHEDGGAVALQQRTETNFFDLITKDKE
jgi:hypothetical protein